MAGITVLTVYSALSEEVRDYARSLHEAVVGNVCREYEHCSGILASSLGDVKVESGSFVVIHVATGGTERLIVDLYGRSRYSVILACGKANSLAAALEARGRLIEEGYNPELVYYEEASDVPGLLKDFYNGFRGAMSLVGFRNVSVGGPSPWLVASASDPQYSRKLDSETLMVEMEKLIEEYNKVDRGFVLKHELYEKLKGLSFNDDALIDSLRIYFALKRIIGKGGFRGVTVKCFDLIELVGNTACLPLAILNSEGIIASCEGDVNMLLTMRLLSSLADAPVWMANPVRIVGEDTVILAHCTAPLSMLSDIDFQTHYESGLGVAVRGRVRQGKVTLARIGGRKLDSIFAVTGEVTRSNMKFKNMCRVQVEVRLDSGVDWFLKNSVGNHVALTYGDHRKALKVACDILGLRPIIYGV